MKPERTESLALGLSRSRSRRLVLIIVCGIALLAAKPPDKALTITVREGESLRDIAQEYFNDPNLWQEILRSNELSSADSVEPGMQLMIPRNEVSIANAALVAALDSIQKATEAGGRVFAAKSLETAVDRRSQAMTLRQKGQWSECHKWAVEAKASADEALQVSLSERNAAAQALLKQQSGSVQSRKSSELAWKSTAKGALLEEQEKVRTLSDSSAEIVFLDESRIQLVANSQAVIQKLRVDRLNSHQQASVSLVEGDAFALLASAGTGKGVEVAVPGISTEGFSKDFWVSRKGKQSKFANYDDEQMEITAGGETVTLGRNQGTIVEEGSRPTTVRDLLPAPLLSAPADDEIAFAEKETVLSWEAVDGAVHYSLEAAVDPSFTSLVFQRSRVAANEYRPKDLEDGVYYWRVSAVDDLGFPGAKSRVRRFRLLVSAGAPYLALTGPEEGAILRATPVTLEGLASPRGSLSVNGTSIALGDEGSFSIEQDLVEGENRLLFEVVDEAGKTSEIARTIVYMPDRPATIEYGAQLLRSRPKRFLTRESELVLSGRTIAGARVEVAGTRITGLTDENGGFELTIPLEEAEAEQELRLRVTAPSGYQSEDVVVIERDREPPELTILDLPPARTAEGELLLKGRVTGSSRLLLNGEPIATKGNAFEIRLALEPGENPIEILASDEVGNETRWTRSVTLDREPPQLKKTRLSHGLAKGGEAIEIVVEATDESEMKRFASALLVVGDWRENLSLSLESDGTYRSDVRIPSSAQGKVFLKHVILEDYIGNKKSYANP